MNASWTKRELSMVRKYYPTMPTPKLAEKLGRTVCSVKTIATKHGIRKDVASNSPFTIKKKALLIKLYPNTLNREIAKRLGVSESSVIAAGFRYGLRKTPEFMRKHSEAGQFKPGQTPKNKGKKWSEFMSKQGQRNSKKTCFKKGHIPVNHRPVGSERLSKDGYIEVKVAEPNRWAGKHRVIWEKRRGKIPAGMIVQFKDGNPRNFSIKNLVLRSRSENMKLNTYHNYPKEIAKAIQLMGALTRQINKR